MLNKWKGLYSRRLAKKSSERGRQMANARWKRFRETAHLRPEPEPKMVRAYRFQFGVRDTLTGEEAWHDLVSVRHAAKALGLIQKYF